MKQYRSSIMYHIHVYSSSRLYQRPLPASSCASSENNDCFPCYHGAAVIPEKYGTVNIFKFIARTPLPETCKSQYFNAPFNLPTQTEMNSLLACAKIQVATGNNMEVQVALPPPPALLAIIRGMVGGPIMSGAYL